mgnify:CR=1 FL=1
MKISIVINCDTRSQRDEFGGANLQGVVNEDFLTDGIWNKVKFFDGFPDKEVIVYIDQHKPLQEETLRYIRTLADTVIIRNHTDEPNFNCWNYIRSLEMASGDIICKIDQDTSCFTSSTEPIHQMINKLDEFAFVSYPSHWSPKPVIDESFGSRTWASTRFFMCKKEALKFEELKNCIIEPNWGYEKYGDSPRRTNWLEHFLTLTNNDSCYYPPVDLNRYAIFSWSSYDKFILKRLNELPYDKVKEFILQRGGINYPCDVFAV